MTASPDRSALLEKTYTAGVMLALCAEAHMRVPHADIQMWLHTREDLHDATKRFYIAERALRAAGRVE